MNDVPARIRAHREALGWSRRQLAEKSEVFENTIENIERGRRPVTIDDLAAIATAFGTDVCGLLGPHEHAPLVIVRTVRAEPDCGIFRKRISEALAAAIAEVT